MARILQVVDVYDALTTARPYKAALSSDDALHLMEEEVAKDWWDPQIFDQFSEMIRDPEAIRCGNRAVLSSIATDRVFE